MATLRRSVTFAAHTLTPIAVPKNRRVSQMPLSNLDRNGPLLTLTRAAQV
jgi:hypothetical protein